MTNVDQNKSLASHMTKGLVIRKNKELKPMMQSVSDTEMNIQGAHILLGVLDGRGSVLIMAHATKQHKKTNIKYIVMDYNF